MYKPLTHRIVQTWDDILAEWHYVLEFRRDGETEFYETEYHGDRDWARRQVNHYRCKVYSEDGEEMALLAVNEL